MSNRLSKAARRKFSEAMRANWAHPEWREKRCARLKEGSAARYAREAGLAVPLVDREVYSPVPKWVPPELRDDYRDFTRLYGEEIAAREVRAMKAEARA